MDFEYDIELEQQIAEEEMLILYQEPTDIKYSMEETVVTKAIYNPTVIPSIPNAISTLNKEAIRKSSSVNDILAAQRARFGDSFGKRESCGNNLGEYLSRGCEVVTSMPLFSRLSDSVCSQFLHKRPADDEQQCTCILQNGKRVFLRQRQLEPVDLHCIINRSIKLSSKSMRDLVGESERMEIASRLRQKQFENDSMNSTAQPRLATSKDLWVDKYAPKSFLQLLSPEKINREVLKSLKAWDGFVFKPKQAKGQKHDSVNNNNGEEDEEWLREAIKRKKKKMRHSGGDGENERDDSDDDDKDDNDDKDDDEDDDDHKLGLAGARNKSKFKPNAGKDLRPEFKVIFLCGPPGTGKTTLAHVLATHCGYRPFEVNASDDRTAQVLNEKLHSAMQSNTIAGDRQPNCIILDEIDGVDSKAAIDMLMKIIAAPLPVSSSAAKTSDKRKPAKAASSQLALTRPLICICNDPYSSVLREMRPHSKIFMFEPPTELRLIQRLRHILVQELGSADVSGQLNSSAFAALCTAGGNDIRSVINTLQFAAMRCGGSSGGRGRGSAEALSAVLLEGTKDQRKDALQIWKEIFSIRELRSLQSSHKWQHTQAQEHLRELALSSSLSSAEDSADNNISDRLFSCGSTMEMIAAYHDNSTIMSGIFENMQHAKTLDSTMGRSVEATEWLSFADCCEGFSRLHADGHQVLQYQPAAAAAVQLVLSSETNFKITWPSKEKGLFFAKQQRLHIADDLVSRCSTKCQSLSSRQNVCLDAVSALMDIISPRIRAVPYLSLSHQEKSSIADAVNAMSVCGLSFVRAPVTVKVQFNYANNANKFFKRNFNSNSIKSYGGNNATAGNNHNNNLINDNNNSTTAVSEAAAAGTSSTDSVQLVLDPLISDLVLFAEPAPQPNSSLQTGYSARKSLVNTSNTSATAEVATVVTRPQLTEECAQLMLQELKKKQLLLGATASAQAPHGVLAQNKATEKGQILKRSLPGDSAVEAKTQPGASGKVSVPVVTSGPAVKTRMGDFFSAKASVQSSTMTNNKSTVDKKKTADKAAEIALARASGAAPADCHASTSTPFTPVSKPLVYFKFVQGFSNAVKRPVTAAEFM